MGHFSGLPKNREGENDITSKIRPVDAESESIVLTESNFLLCSVFSVHIISFQAVISGMCLRRNITVKIGGVRGKGRGENKLHLRKNEHEQNKLMDYWKINPQKRGGLNDTSERERGTNKERGVLNYSLVSVCSIQFCLLTLSDINIRITCTVADAVYLVQKENTCIEFKPN